MKCVSHRGQCLVPSKAGGWLVGISWISLSGPADRRVSREPRYMLGSFTHLWHSWQPGRLALAHDRAYLLCGGLVRSARWVLALGFQPARLLSPPPSRVTALVTCSHPCPQPSGQGRVQGANLPTQPCSPAKLLPWSVLSSQH